MSIPFEIHLFDPFFRCQPQATVDYLLTTNDRRGGSPHQNLYTWKNPSLYRTPPRTPRVSPPDFGTQPSPARVKPKKTKTEERGVEMLVKAAQEVGAVFSWSIKSKQPTNKKNNWPPRDYCTLMNW